MDCKIIGNTLKLPFGTKFGIIKHGRPNNLIDGNHINEFFAIFDETDVDFEVMFDNREFDRGINIGLTINKKQYWFYCKPREYWSLQALESNGRKLHLISHNTDIGRELVAQTAHKYAINHELASSLCSKIEFKIDVEEFSSSAWDTCLFGTEINLFVKTLNGKTINIGIGLNNTVHDLKIIIGEREGIPSNEQRLLFAGNQLNDDKQIADYDLKNDNTLHLVLSLNGGWTEMRLTDVTEDSSDSDTDADSDTNSFVESSSSDQSNKSNDINGSQLFSGERGIICFGETTHQRLIDYCDFKKDCNIMVNSFIIEMRMESRMPPI